MIRIFLVAWLLAGCSDYSRERIDCVDGCPAEEPEARHPRVKSGKQPPRNEAGPRGPAGPRGQPGPAGRPGESGKDGAPGQDGHVGEDGDVGPQGSDGLPGEDGYSVVFSVVPADSACAAGGWVYLMAQDLDRDGVLSTDDGDIYTSAICNGQDGEDGSDAAPSPYAIVELIDPCGDAPGVVDEVLLLLESGDILVSFSDNANGKNTRFSVLGTGTYVTTDGTQCQFAVHDDGQVTW